jgi:hypothetical protein
MMHRTRLKVISHSLFTFVLHALLSIATAEQNRALTAYSVVSERR